jgi:hypothetical protein
MSDVTKLTAHQLETRVRRYCMDNRTVNQKGEDALLELVRRAADKEPDDILAAIKRAYTREP